jgi:hypothetical protein
MYPIKAKILSEKADKKKVFLQKSRKAAAVIQ